MLKNMTVGTKIITGFSLMLVLMLAILITGWLGLNSAASGFTEYREMALDSNLSGRLQANMLMTRLAAKDYIANGNEDILSIYNEREAAMKNFSTEMEGAIKDPERKKLVVAANQNIANYHETFKDVRALMSERDTILESILNVKGAEMENALTSIMKSAKADGDADAAYNAGSAVRSLLLARLYIMKFLDSPEQTTVDRVNQEKADFTSLLTILDRELQNEHRRQQLGIVKEAAIVYFTSFDKLVSVITKRDSEIQNGLDVLGPQIAANIEDVKLSIIKRQDELGPALVAANNLSITVMIVIGLTTVVLGSLFAFLITAAISRPLKQLMINLKDGADQVTSASEQVAGSSQQLASGASQQASSLEEISSSLEEMSAMTKQTAENASLASQHSNAASAAARDGEQAMRRMSDAIAHIKDSADETAKIVKTIDEIAFQTNLLALNAAVEAARAGEAGKGFAVVAEEVRNLARRSADAAKSTSELIDQSRENAGNGVQVTDEVAASLKNIFTEVEKITSINAEVAQASNQQTDGIEQVNHAVAELNNVTQDNASSSEESASASEELSAQANSIMDFVAELERMVGADSGHRVNTTKTQRQLKQANPQISEFSDVQEFGGVIDQKRKELLAAATSRAGGSRQTQAAKAVAPQKVIPLDDDELSDF